MNTTETMNTTVLLNALTNDVQMLSTDIRLVKEIYLPEARSEAHRILIEKRLHAMQTALRCIEAEIQLIEELEEQTTL